MKTALLALCASTSNTAAAQPQLSVQGIIVNPVQTALDVKA